MFRGVTFWRYREGPHGKCLSRRNQYLWDARRALRHCEMSAAQFKKIEDRAVDDAITSQESADPT
jgi:hypothetical protein